MENLEALLIHYNETCDQYFEERQQEQMKAAKQAKNDKIEEAFFSYISQSIDELNIVVEKWEHSPNPQIQGQTPLAYFDALQDFDDIVKAFLLAVLVTRADIPPCIDHRFKAFGETASALLLEMATKSQVVKDLCQKHSLVLQAEKAYKDYLADIRILSMKTLGFWNVPNVAPVLLDYLYNLPDEDEFLSDFIIESLETLGGDCVDRILERLEISEYTDERDEMLLTALATIGAKAPSDRIYRCLKNGFYKGSNKALGALCLRDYGDGRAIPALRGYVEKNAKELDQATFFEIKYSVEQLGGNIDDLAQLFKNYNPETYGR